MAATVAGQRQILAYTSSALVALLPTGETLWTKPWHMTVAQPVIVPPDRIFVSTTQVAGSTFEGGSELFRISFAEGKAQVETVWESREMRNYWSGSVAHDGYLYGFDNATLRCVSLETGESKWARRGLGKGSLILADGLLILWSDQAVLTLAEATPEGYQQKGQVQVFDVGRTWAPPALADGRLFLRGGPHLACFDVKG